ncbi:MAG: glycosyltransferase family 39 protein [Planctomycetes bacterium]|nr:glycosyltransferase family 39 protein [Planctomycetota bacterium]
MDSSPSCQPCPQALEQPPWARADTLVLFTLLAACLPLYFLGLGGPALDNRGEPREGLIVQEMALRHEWLLPIPNGTMMLEKPPLFPWLGALCSVASGGEVTEGTIRFPSAVMATLGVLLTFLLGRRLAGRGPGAGGAFLLCLSITWVNLARRARIDMTLATLMAAALYCFLRAHQSRARRGAWGLLASVPLALATLAKGPMGVIFPVGALFGCSALRALLDRSGGDASASGERLTLRAAVQREVGVLREMRPFGCVGLFLLFVCGWYVPAWLRGGSEFLYVNLYIENIGMPLGLVSRGGHEHTLWWYPQYLLLGFLPWSLFLPMALFTAVGRARRAPTVENLFALAWAGVFFAGLSAAAGKRADYLVILMPAVALTTGAWLSEALSAPALHRKSLALPVLAYSFLSAVAAVGLAWIAHGRDPALPSPRMWGVHTNFYGLWLPALLAAICASCVLVLLLLRKDRSRTAAGLFAGMSAGVTLVGVLVLNPEARETVSLKPFVLHVAALAGPEGGGSEIVMANDFSYAIPFYLRRQVPNLPVHQVAAFLTAKPGRYCFVTEPTYRQRKEELGDQVKVLARSEKDMGDDRFVLLGDASAPTDETEESEESR